MSKIRTRRVVTRAVLPPLAAGGLIALWGVAVEPRMLDERHEVAWLPSLPADWDGGKVALLADFQVGMVLANIDTVRRAIDRTITEQPALVLLAGDLLYGSARQATRQIGTVVDLVSPLVQADIATYAVLGNHDYPPESDGSKARTREVASNLRRELESVGVRVLHNDAIALQPPTGPGRSQLGQGDESLYLVGIGAHRPGESQPREALAQVPQTAARIVFLHNPASFADLPAYSAPLTLAGHTHGGQIRLPGKPSWALARLNKPWPQYLDGWIDDYGQPGNRLFVNRGIGFSRVPVRIGCPPELTLLTLWRANP